MARIDLERLDGVVVDVFSTREIDGRKVWCRAQEKARVFKNSRGEVKIEWEIVEGSIKPVE